MTITAQTVGRIIALTDRYYDPMEGSDGTDQVAWMELHRGIQALAGEELDELLALMFLGRGEVTSDGWDALVRDAHRQRMNTGADEVADYMSGKMQLAEYLMKGWSLMKLVAMA